MILRLSLDLPDDTVYIRTTRLLAKCLLEDIGVTRPVIDDVQNIVGELCSNVIRHAQSTSSFFALTFEFYQPKIVITITDKGKGFVIDNVPAVGTMRPDGKGGQRVGGFGLSLLEGLSDKIDFSETDPHGTTVRVEKNLLYDSKADADESTERDQSTSGAIKADKG
jgi:serine/threonine-protein kinase RsbW